MKTENSNKTEYNFDIIFEAMDKFNTEQISLGENIIITSMQSQDIIREMQELQNSTEYDEIGFTRAH